MGPFCNFITISPERFLFPELMHPIPILVSCLKKKLDLVRADTNQGLGDVVAGAFIVQQAGGKVTDFSGSNNYIFGKEIAAACGVHDEMISVIQKYWK